ncbi:Hypothetical protein NTJ_05097 [Nesidiocoris tenuis]|uniref:DUF4780 domain-containing protein n=1 Tax=Nesidiocoris tenuis TaxID=355587 RepID=A0ABN7AJ74_9HEMI|nr:Hypothetical protein NTJ_05097 [Nesidiocoris tenuis]
MSTPNKEKNNLKQNPSSEEASGLTSEIDLLKVGDSASDAGQETSGSLVERRLSFEGALAQSGQLGVIAPGKGSSCASGAGVTGVPASGAAAGGPGGPSGTHGSPKGPGARPREAGATGTGASQGDAEMLVDDSAIPCRHEAPVPQAERRTSFEGILAGAGQVVAGAAGVGDPGVSKAGGSGPPGPMAVDGANEAGTSGDGASDTKDLKKWVKFTTAERKRFKRLCKNGMEVSEARKEVMLTSSNKRVHSSNESTPELRQTKKVRRSEISPGADGGPGQGSKSYSEAARGVRIGVGGAGFPDVLLDISQLDAVQGAILKAVSTIPKKTAEPKFSILLYRGGWLLIHCEDSETAGWLRKVIPSLSPWENARLRVPEEEEFPRPRYAVGFFPNSSNDATGFIMDLLTNQNHSLNVERWRVTSRMNNGTCAVISFALNNSEAEALEERGGQVHFRFGKETIRVKKASGAGGSGGCGGDGEAKEIKPEVDEEPMGPSPPPVAGPSSASRPVCVPAGAGVVAAALVSSAPSPLAPGAEPRAVAQTASGRVASGARRVGLVAIGGPRGPVNPAGVLLPPPWAAGRSKRGRGAPSGNGRQEPRRKGGKRGQW